LLTTQLSGQAGKSNQLDLELDLLAARKIVPAARALKAFSGL